MEALKKEVVKLILPERRVFWKLRFLNDDTGFGSILLTVTEGGNIKSQPRKIKLVSKVDNETLRKE